MWLQKRQVMEAFIISQFGNCPLAWMFQGRRLKSKINSLHQQALKITYKEESSPFQDLVRKDDSVLYIIGNQNLKRQLICFKLKTILTLKL